MSVFKQGETSFKSPHTTLVSVPAHIWHAF